MSFTSCSAIGVLTLEIRPERGSSSVDKRSFGHSIEYVRFRRIDVDSQITKKTLLFGTFPSPSGQGKTRRKYTRDPHVPDGALYENEFPSFLNSIRV